MKKGHLFPWLMLLLLMPVAVLAKDKSDMNVKDILSIVGYAVTGAGGFLTSLLILLPMINKIGKAIEVAREETLSFVTKWKDVVDGGVRQDLRRLVKRYDDVTERTADLLEALKLPALKRLARKLRSLINPTMFD